MKLVVGVSGASCILYAIEFLKACKQLSIETHLVMTNWAISNLELETEYCHQDIIKLASFSYDNSNLAAPISSGSFRHDGMVVVPCSMKTLASIAIGYTDTLVARAADVTIKEHRKLILVPRETPLSAIHLENMLKLARLNITMLPPMPALYIKPKCVEDLVLFSVSRILDQFGIENDLSKRWE